MYRTLGRAVIGVVAVIVVGMVGVLAFGTATPPPELSSISTPFKSIDFSDAPALAILKAENGTAISYRRYGPLDATNTLIALHGSSATSLSLHVFSKTLAVEKIAVYVPDLRGHGDTGRRGDVDYIGQPDDDLTSLIRHVRSAHPAARLTLAGFSLGGGLALRNAGNANGNSIDRTVLLTPALGNGAPTMRPQGDDGWARAHVPRIVALTILNRLGIHFFDGLEAITFAVAPGTEKIQTRSYSWRLLKSLFPDDYRKSFASATKPMQIFVGEKDELFLAAQFEPTVRQVRGDVSVTIIPGIDHVNLTLDPRALAIIVAALRQY